ncbi:MAG: S-adenosylmethionine synthetase N-terminal domain-containing protein, partial [Campylobacter ureolyticus]
MYLFTSEVVSPGHPDKCADIIADSIVDEVLGKDKDARLASEVFVAGNHIVIGGEVKSKVKFSQSDYENIVKNALSNIGYSANPHFTKEQCLHLDDIEVHVFLNEQSPDISTGVDQSSGEIGAGDQGIMLSLIHISEPT